MEIQNGACALTGSACLEKGTTLTFTGSQLERIQAAGEAYRHLFEIRGTAPEWPKAHADWQHLAETVAVAAIHMLEVMEAGHD